MFHFIKYIFVLSVAVVTSLSALEYQLENCGTLSYVGYQFDVKSINNQGVITGDFTYTEQGHARSHGIFQYDRNDGLRRLTLKQSYLAKINDNGLIIGNTSHSKAFMIKNMDAESLKILDFDHIRTSRAYDLNNLGQVVGLYQTHDVANYPSNIGGFIWDGSEFMDFGPNSAFAQEFIPLGYDVLGVEIHAINDRGNIAGIIYCGKYNPYTHQRVFTGKKIFFYDSAPHVLPYIDKNLEWIHGEVYLTEDDRIIYSTWYNGDTTTHPRYTTYSWKTGHETRVLGNFKVMAINGAGDAIGLYDGSKPRLVLLNGKIYQIFNLLGIDENSDQFSDSFEFSSVKPVAINNDQDITGCGGIWNMLVPFIASPKK